MMPNAVDVLDPSTRPLLIADLSTMRPKEVEKKESASAQAAAAVIGATRSHTLANPHPALSHASDLRIYLYASIFIFLVLLASRGCVLWRVSHREIDRQHASTNCVT
jgi:hypothetical protein